jgi:hypothetical protein
MRKASVFGSLTNSGSNYATAGAAADTVTRLMRHPLAWARFVIQGVRDTVPYTRIIVFIIAVFGGLIYLHEHAWRERCYTVEPSGSVSNLFDGSRWNTRARPELRKRGEESVVSPFCP